MNIPQPAATPAPLRDARVLIVGVGGLGSPAAMALAEAGVGTLGLVDPDQVEISNLHRQPLYAEADVGRPKVEAAAERLAATWPHLRVVQDRRRFGIGDARLLAGWDAVVDGTDTVDAKFVVNDAAVAAGVPLAHAGAVGFRAQVLAVLPGESACYRCVFEEPPAPEDAPSCEAAGVLGPVVALAGAWQAAQVLQVLSGVRPGRAARLRTIDLRTGTWRSVPLARNPACAACGPTTIVEAARRSAVP
ncbi:MAG: HesA/MoeB/ThiF family protein [Candidatus Binatia bacterium]